jgi:hypothetical protein
MAICLGFGSSRRPLVPYQANYPHMFRHHYALCLNCRSMAIVDFGVIYPADSKATASTASPESDVMVAASLSKP